VNHRVVTRLFSPRLLSVVLTTLAFTAAAHATQVALVGDASVNTARPSTNFGSLSNLYVGNGNTALLQFDLTTLPTGLTSGQIAHATLTVFVNRVNGIGLVTLAPATSAWSESSVTSATAPPLGVSAGMFTASTAGQYVTLDVTSLVQGWVTTPATNFGLALSSGTANLLLDSKENDETAHPATLDITITSTGATGPQGPIGPQGPQGAPGLPGANGVNGAPGATGTTGANGAPGPVGATGTFSAAGNWSPSTTYQVGQVVFCAACSTNGSSYIALATNTNIDPPTQPLTWSLVAQVGATGPTGATGAIGPMGQQGPIGPTGNTGSAGATGAAGATGLTGPAGPIGAMGNQGIPGPTGATGTLSAVTIWNPSTSYTIGQVVFCNVCTTGGSSYIALANNTNQDPSTQPTIWQLIAQAGGIGAQGIMGVTGPAGANGANGAAGSNGAPGATGAPGPFVGGNYSASVDYPAGSVVAFSGSTYLAVQANGPPTAVTPGSNAAVWVTTTGSSSGSGSSSVSYVSLLGSAGGSFASGSSVLSGFSFVSQASSGISYNATTGASVVQAAGLYQFTFSVQEEIFGSTFAVQVNGVQVANDIFFYPANIATGALGPISGSGVLTLNAGDSVNIITEGAAQIVNTNFSLVSLGGTTGPTGATGAQGIEGPIGATGAPGATGVTGPAGAPGAAGGVLDFADFFALMPPDNAATVAVGTDVSFPEDGPSAVGSLITRTSASSIQLSAIGTYQVLFQVSVTEAGQLVLTLNGADLTQTVVGRATGTSQIVGMALVQTTNVDSVLTVRNPAGNSTALNITPLAGGTSPVSAHLVITRIQ
jgi:hypothetical protein